MTPELWQQVCSAFDRADGLELGPRMEFLQRLRRENAQVAREVENLLQEDGARGSPLPADLSTHLWEKIAGPDDPSPPPAREWPHQAGPFWVEGEIARGGMGVVLRARDLKFGRPLAIKILAGKHQGNSDLIHRFLEEARLMGRLQHPGIPPVHDLGELPDGRPFFAMKLIEGQTLAEMLRGQESELEASTKETSHTQGPRFLSIFEQVCQAVAFAHAQGVIHRDLKPANIMVGAFGEVQVMDWGLAKQRAEGRRPEAEDREPRGETRDSNKGGSFENLQSALCPPPSAYGPLPSVETALGSVLGTPAYMAPEQARGEVENLDERTDVFGLGAILCEILTGKPPFARESPLENHRLAAAGDLADAFARLEHSPVDPELIDLARRCLAPDRENRPGHAGAVAAEMAAYQATVRERLRRAEREQAAAEAHAAEERKRRRVTVALAATLLLLGATVGGAAWWFSAESQRRAEEESRRQAEADRKREQAKQGIEAALSQARKARDKLQQQLRKPGGVFELVNDPARWENLIQEAQTPLREAEAWQTGELSLAQGELADQLVALKAALAQDREDRQTALALEEIRLLAAGAATSAADFPAPTAKKPGLDAAQQIGLMQPAVTAKATGNNVYRPKQTAEAYIKILKTARLDLSMDTPDALASRVKKSPIREQLIVSLDDLALALWRAGAWAKLKTPNPKTAWSDMIFQKALRAVKLADPDPWRDQVRDPTGWGDANTLGQLAAKHLRRKDLLAELSPQMISLVGRLLINRKCDLAEKWLRTGQARHPADFYLNLDLGEFLLPTKPAEALGFFRVALAARPDSPLAHYHLGSALAALGRPDEGLVHLRLAVKAFPNYLDAHARIGDLLYSRGDLDGAISAYQKVISLNPPDFWWHHRLGLALLDKKDLDGAIKICDEVLGKEPTYALAYHLKGTALWHKKDLAGAQLCFQKAIEARPKQARGHLNLGLVLLEKRELDMALASFSKAAQLEPANALAHYYMGLALREKQDWKGAAASFRKAAQLNPNYAQVSPP